MHVELESITCLGQRFRSRIKEGNMFEPVESASNCYHMNNGQIVTKKLIKYFVGFIQIRIGNCWKVKFARCKGTDFFGLKLKALT